ncbi:MAG: response regulator receiver [Acidobacteriaceae bacterium]|nr:response regulator receiver [Acidobacteriaceae bacterium]
MDRTRVLVVDDHPIVRMGICRILSSAPDFDVVCETANGEDAVQKAQEHLPDVVLLDISLPGINGIEAARRIRAVSPLSHVILMSEHDSSNMVEEAFLAGGDGYVLKSEAGQELLNAIQSVQGGTQYVSESIGVSQAVSTFNIN